MTNPISIVINEDCMDFMGRYPDKFFDLAIVDPPYGIKMGKRVGATKNGLHLCGYEEDTRYKKSNWDDKIPSKEYFIELFRVSKNQIIWGGNYFTHFLPVSRGWIFWDKKPIVDNYSDGELAWSSFDKVLKRIEIMWNGKIRNAIEKGYIAIHPTQKPIALYHFCLKNYAQKGDKILDTHLGSGSSRIAAYKMGFDFYACDGDADYISSSENRFKKAIAEPIFDQIIFQQGRLL